MSRDTSIQSLAKEMRKGFEQTNKSIDELAGMVKCGFDAVEGRLTALEQGHDRIELRLLNVAYQIDVQELQKRVARLEKKVGLKK